MAQIVAAHYARPQARRHLWAGLAMAAIGMAYAGQQLSQWLAAHPMAAHGLAASLMAGLATGLVEPLGGLAGVVAATLAEATLPIALPARRAPCCGWSATS